MRAVNVALIAITPFETPPRLQRIFNPFTSDLVKALHSVILV